MLKASSEKMADNHRPGMSSHSPQSLRLETFDKSQYVTGVGALRLSHFWAFC